MKRLVLFFMLIIGIISMQADAQTLRPYFEKICKTESVGNMLYGDDARKLITEFESNIPFEKLEIWGAHVGGQAQEFQEVFNPANDIINSIPENLNTIGSFNDFNVFELFCAPMPDNDDMLEILVFWSRNVYGDVLALYGTMTTDNYRMLQTGEINMNYFGTKINPMPGFVFNLIFKGTSWAPDKKPKN